MAMEGVGGADADAAGAGVKVVLQVSSAVHAVYGKIDVGMQGYSGSFGSHPEQRKEKSHRVYAKLIVNRGSCSTRHVHIINTLV